MAFRREKLIPTNVEIPIVGLAIKPSMSRPITRKRKEFKTLDNQVTQNYFLQLWLNIV